MGDYSLINLIFGKIIVDIYRQSLYNSNVKAIRLALKASIGVFGGREKDV